MVRLDGVLGLADALDGGVLAARLALARVVAREVLVEAVRVAVRRAAQITSA